MSEDAASYAVRGERADDLDGDGLTIGDVARRRIQEDAVQNCYLCDAQMFRGDGDLSMLFLCRKCEYAWSPEDFNANIYDEAYAEKYDVYAKTALGTDLTAYRTWFVLHHVQDLTGNESLLDFGCGHGQFAQTVARFFSTYACDVNEEYRAYWDSYAKQVCYSQAVPDQEFEVATFFDSLEHVADPRGLIAKISAPHVITSIPIVPLGRLADSKHLRPLEHLHYFTKGSLVKMMEQLGYTLEAEGTGETELGREDIETYYFHRGN